LEKETAKCPQDCKKDIPPNETSTEASEKNTVGVVGCSITINALEGYQSLGGDVLWPVEAVDDYGGGSVSAWHQQLNSGEGGRWDTFKKGIEQFPETNKIWWELCSDPEAANLTYEDLLEILGGIKRISNQSEVYVTPMPLFPQSADKFCMKNNGPAVLKEYADRMVSEGLAKAGPMMASLDGALSAPDGCHASPEGKKIWGMNLMGFFGVGTGTGKPPENTRPKPDSGRKPCPVCG
jgi:hypothetical protein